MFNVIKTCSTPQERAAGLSDYPSIEDNEALLFKFAEGSHSPFWNKGVAYPIDIGFYDSDGAPIFITNMEANSLKLVYSPRKYYWVLETNRGKLPAQACLFDLI